MGSVVSTGDALDKIAHQAKGTDVWTTIQDGVDTKAQGLLFMWLDHQRNSARKVALEEQNHRLVRGLLTISQVTASLHSTGDFEIELKVHHSSKKSHEVSANTNKPSWTDSFSFDVSGRGVQVTFQIFKARTVHLLPIAVAHWHLGFKQSKKNNDVTLDLFPPLHVDKHKPIGTIKFAVEFAPSPSSTAIKDRGFLYADYLPVLDPNVPLPLLATPDKAFSQQDNAMTDTMKAIAFYWLVEGAENARKMVPQPLTDRVDDGEGDEWFVHRRINGACPGFVKPNATKGSDRPWDFEIEWDFRFLDVSTHLKSGVYFPLYICVRFVLSADGRALHAHSIHTIFPGKEPAVQVNDGSVAWKEAKYLFRAFEVNTRFTWAHVGVHFNVEQYAMAVYRNLPENHPIWDLLTPHFKNIITNDRKVVRPQTDGVVTKADVFTYDGQIKLLQERFKHFSYKDTPHRVLPTTLVDNGFENSVEVMWNLLTQYVTEYFAEHPISIDPYIQAMSNDLQTHALNTTPDCMTIKNVDELKQMCIYTIFQAIFYHAWIHWNAYDDFVPVLKYDETNKEAAKLENESNMIQTFVTYVSPSLKQWPILDPELGGPPRLRELLMDNAALLDPNIQVATLIMAPNT